MVHRAVEISDGFKHNNTRLESPAMCLSAIGSREKLLIRKFRQKR